MATKYSPTDFDAPGTLRARAWDIVQDLRDHQGDSSYRLQLELSHLKMQIANCDHPFTQHGLQCSCCGEIAERH